MFTFIICKHLNIKDQVGKSIMVLIAMCFDATIIALVLEGLGVIS